MKPMLEETLQKLMEAWDESKYVCFAHYSKEEGIAAGYYNEVLSGRLPCEKIEAGGVVALIDFDTIATLVKVKSKDPNYVKCITWSLTLPNTPLKTITSVMLRLERDHVDMILEIFNPEFAQAGWIVFHFFDYEKAVSITGPLMDVY
jgi:hypothetical protein